MSPRRCESAAMLKHGVDSLRNTLCQPETEDSWDAIAHSISDLSTLCTAGGFDFPQELVPIIRSLSRPLNSAMNSERTRLSGTAIDLIGVVASGLGSGFDPLLALYFPSLVTLCSRTNKVIITRARGCIMTIIETTQIPSILPYFLQSVKDKSASLRITVAEGTLACINCFNPPDLEKEARAKDVEAIIRATAKDANADVRKLSRRLFEAYKLLLPGRVDSFTAPLTPTIKKYLDIKASAMPASSRPNLSSKSTARSLAKLPLSSSTSALSSTKSTFTSSASGRIEPQARPASSSAISSPSYATDVGPPLAKTHTGSSKSKMMTNMPPPDFVPVRMVPPIRHTLSASRSAVDVRTKSRSIVRSDRSQDTADESSDAARRPAQGHGAITALPKRPAATSSVSERFVRAPNTVVPVGGARRVILPDHPSGNIESDVTKSTKSTSRLDSATSTAANRPRSASNKPPAKDGLPTKPVPKVSVLKGKEKAKPVPMIETKKSIVGTSSKVVNGDSGFAPPNSKFTRSITQPTISQLSRAKPPVERKIKEVAKPGWGQPAPRKVKSMLIKSSVSKMVVPDVPAPDIVSSSSAVDPQEVIAPTQVPLPPSPPPLNANVGAAEVEGSETTETGAALHLDEDPKDTPQVESVTGRGPSSDPSQRIDEEDIAPVQVSSDPNTPLADRRKDILFDTQLSANGTPISSLLSSIQRGFLFTPCSPLSPPQSYLSRVPDDGTSSFPFTGFGVKPLGQTAGLFGVPTRKGDYDRQALSDMELNQ